MSTGGFRRVTDAHPGAYPLLERALVDAKDAWNPRVTWLVGSGGHGLVEEYNYCEIFKADSAETVAALVEAAIWAGRRTVGGNLRRTMGGITFFKADQALPVKFALRVLRDLHERKQPATGWLCEVSVAVL